MRTTPSPSWATLERILTEGSVRERLRRDPALRLDRELGYAALLFDDRGRTALERVYREYLDVAFRHGFPMILETPTWKVDRDRIEEAGLRDKLDVNAVAVRFLRDLRESCGAEQESVVIAGLMGCRGDAYSGEDAMSQREAAEYHLFQAESLARGGCDLLLAATIPSASEALGIARAMAGTGYPCAVSFIINRKAHLLDGTPLLDVVQRMDDTLEQPPLFYLVNCIHPAVVREALESLGARERLLERLIGIQANSSSRSLSELDGLSFLDTGEPEAFGREMVGLSRDFGFRILGGCCGTDSGHIEQIARHWRPGNAVG